MNPNKSSRPDPATRDKRSRPGGDGDADRYGARPYEDMPSVTNRDWGSRAEADEQASFGPPGLGGYGDFREDRGGREHGQRNPGQGGYGEDQGRDAQSGHSRGAPGGAGHREHVARGPGGGTSGHRGLGPKGYRRSDTSIADEIYARLTDDEAVDASEILVMVEDAEVTLTGEVPERRMKHRAEDLVDSVRGVRDIHNRIRVDRGTDAAGPPGAAVRSGQNQVGSGFSSSGRLDSPISRRGDDH